MANQKERNQVLPFGESYWDWLPPELHEQIIVEKERQERAQERAEALARHKASFLGALACLDNSYNRWCVDRGWHQICGYCIASMRLTSRARRCGSYYDKNSGKRLFDANRFDPFGLEFPELEFPELDLGEEDYIVF